MPFYEYQCKNCGHTLEAMQKISEAPLKKCPHCGKPQLERLMSAPVFRLKGGGWYETDFKGDQDKKRNLAGGDDADAPKADSKSDSTEGGKGEPKTADAGKETAKTEKPADKAAGGASAGSVAGAKSAVSGAGKARSSSSGSSGASVKRSGAAKKSPARKSAGKAGGSRKARR